MQVTTMGIDLAKQVFQVHGIDTRGTVVLKKRLTRSALHTFMANLPPCRVGMEVCGSANCQGAPNSPQFGSSKIPRLGYVAVDASSTRTSPALSFSFSR